MVDPDPVTFIVDPDVRAVVEISRPVSVSIALAVRFTASKAFDACVISRVDATAVVFCWFM